MSSKQNPDTRPRQEVSLIAGNASHEVKDFLCNGSLAAMTNGNDGRGFATSTGQGLKVREISFIKKAEEPGRMEGRVVFEITVDEGLYWFATVTDTLCSHSHTTLEFIDMLNGMGSMHGGCTAYLVDV